MEFINLKDFKSQHASTHYEDKFNSNDYLKKALNNSYSTYLNNKDYRSLTRDYQV